MSGQILAACIMFFITIGFAALFWFPAVKFQQNSELVRFYWIGFWAFLGGLAALSGAQAVLLILGHDVQHFGQALMSGISASFVVFVMFAWGRLSLKGLSKAVKKVKN